LPDLRLLLRHVHRQFDELPGGGSGPRLPGNGTVVATHADRKELFLEAGRKIVEIARRHYETDDFSVLPRSVATFAAFENAMTLDIAMGAPPTPCCICWRRRMRARCLHHARHRPPVAPGAGAVQSRALGRRRPRRGRPPAGGIMAILGELDRAGLIDASVPTIHSETLAEALQRWDVQRTADDAVRVFYRAGPAACRHRGVQPGQTLGRAGH